MGLKIFSLPSTVIVNIATLNCKNLTLSSSAEKFQWIANQILESNADIICLQEINKTDALKNIVDLLGSDKYEECHHSDALDTSRIHEYIGYIYKSDKIKSMGCVTFTNEEKTKYIGGINRLMIRAPAYAKFRIEDKIDIILIGYHTNQKNPMYDCIRIKDNIKAIQYTNPSVKTYFILGDFNTHSRDMLAFGKLYKRDWKPVFTSKNINTNTLNNEQYDHIWYHSDKTKLISPPRVLRGSNNPGPVTDAINEDSVNAMVNAMVEAMREIKDELKEAMKKDKKPEVIEHSDHCLVIGSFKVSGYLSINEDINPPNMSEVMKPNIKKDKVINVLCSLCVL